MIGTWRRSRVRVNGRIRARQVRVVGPDSAQLGVMARTDALAVARDAGLDLVEVAPKATPPVCRVMDFAKYDAHGAPYLPFCSLKDRPQNSL